ncbi:hypothetical protein GUJ93_ZPchr0006g41401 [Zizania palustris]|uniref:Uncharacterized protein n=1 Tax=Zizania palustris TaxID=103762 RepID=A0A8J5SN48_ZIZPA|nr:hypothetical protein GUJ93_ZPchr0006g41401 [Zizania palustris]
MPRHRDRDEMPPADCDRLLAEEIFYLHSLWRRGPEVSASFPAPIPPRGSASLAETRRWETGRRRRRRLEHHAQKQEQEQDPGLEWPVAPSPPVSSTPWPDHASSLSQHPPKQQPSPGSLSQQAALRTADNFFSNRGLDGDGEGSESEGEEEDTAAGFFMGLFEREVALREHYERRWEEEDFMCMACAGRKGKTRKFNGCVALVQHAQAATRCGRPRAHRALAAAICRVLGWDIKRLPSIVIDPRGTLGHALATEASGAVAAQEAKGNIDAQKKDGSSGDKDTAKF